MTRPPDDSMPETILLVDDDAAVLRSMERVLRNEGFVQTRTCQDARRAVELAVGGGVGVVLLDLAMPHVSGEDVLHAIAVASPDTPVIIVTALDQADVAVRCMKAGAFDYLVKPVDFARLMATVLRALEHRRLRMENRELRRRVSSPSLRHPESFAPILTCAPAMLAMFAYVEAIASSAEPVLIVGETGVGKELVAAALHQVSGRGGPLVSVNVAGIDDAAFADTLFGHTKGAFTGAEQPRSGLVEKAAGGTLFLDEIGDLRVDIQTKLLRLIQEREFFALGSDQPRRSDCRVIAATNRDLRERMRAGAFREDLYYRLHAHLVRVPPLRERLGDIPLLVDQFLVEAAQAHGRAKATPPRELATYLRAYAFPGNVRELRAMVMDAVARHEKGVLSLDTFLAHMDRTAEPRVGDAEAGADAIQVGHEFPTLDAATRLLVREALRRADGNQSAAARLLGISRRTLNRYVTSGFVGLSDEDPVPNGSPEP